MSSFTIKQGDTSPSIRAVLYYGEVPVDLTGASVSFAMRRVSRDRCSQPVAPIRGPAVIEVAAGGQVRYDFQPGDTSKTGQYSTEFVVLLNGREERFPGEGFVTINVSPSI